MYAPNGPHLLGWVILAAALLLMHVPVRSDEPAPGVIEWAGLGCYRVLLRVEPHGSECPRPDEIPAWVRLDLSALLAAAGGDGRPDLSTLQVVRYDPTTGRPLPYDGFAVGRGPCDLPYRFDEVDPRPDWFLYNLGAPVTGPGASVTGDLVWRHIQESNEPSYCAVYFDVTPPGQEAGQPARAWIGDGDALFQEDGPFPSVLQPRPYPFDWDGDGKLELIIGHIRGYVFLYRNLGTPQEPRFARAELVLADGQPIKVPWSSAPLVCDWNGDGLPDLLVAQEPEGLIHYYQNVGTRTAPLLTHRGLIMADGKELRVPFEPVPEAPGVFRQEYVGSPEVCDWNGDGRPDLLIGGYVTGQVFLYENVDSNPDGTPVLQFRGPLFADGQPIDVSWCATPTVADFDGDGRPELVTGSMYVSPTGGETPAPDRPGLFLFRNTATPQAPHLTQVPFPLEGPWRGNYFLNPRFVDWDGDGLLDLIVADPQCVGLYRNVGTPTAPRFRRQDPWRSSWVLCVAHADWLGDWDGEGGIWSLNALGGQSVVLGRMIRRSNPPRFETVGELRTAAGSSMVQPPAHGDPWAAAIACDWDNDGDLDVMVGDVAGFVWYFENVGTRAEPRFAEGQRLMLADGSPLLVGLPPDTPVTDFTALQGNRAVPACADFNGDGKPDLVVGDAVGGVTYFENVGDARTPRFAPGHELLRLPGRVHVAAGDLFGDGTPGLVLAASAAGEGQQVMLVRNFPADGRPGFQLPGTYLPLCWIPYPQPALADMTGDGDLDLMISSSYGAMYLVEHSFIRQGAAAAQVVRCERRPASGH